MGNQLSDMKQLDAAEAAYRKALAICEESCRRNWDNIKHFEFLAGTQHRLGEALERLHRDTDALAMYHAALRTRRQVLDRQPENSESRRLLDREYGNLIR